MLRICTNSWTIRMKPFSRSLSLLPSKLDIHIWDLGRRWAYHRPECCQAGSDWSKGRGGGCSSLSLEVEEPEGQEEKKTLALPTPVEVLLENPKEKGRLLHSPNPKKKSVEPSPTRCRGRESWCFNPLKLQIKQMYNPFCDFSMLRGILTSEDFLHLEQCFRFTLLICCGQMKKQLPINRWSSMPFVLLSPRRRQFPQWW